MQKEKRNNRQECQVYTQQIDDAFKSLWEVINSGDVSFQETGLSSRRPSSESAHWFRRRGSLQTGRQKRWLDQNVLADYTVCLVIWSRGRRLTLIYKSYTSLKKFLMPSSCRTSCSMMNLTCMADSQRNQSQASKAAEKGYKGSKTTSLISKIKSAPIVGESIIVFLSVKLARV